MNTNSKKILEELGSLNKQIVRDLRKRGVVPPRKNSDGSIKVGNFTIKKNENGFFRILDQNQKIIVDNINLPHSAALMANRLALGYWSDKSIIDLDRRYGHYMFDEELYKKRYQSNILSKKYDRAEILSEKLKTVKIKRQQLKQEIVQGFDKLISIV